MTSGNIIYNNVLDLRSINRVRQGHQYNSLSEIFSANGQTIDVRCIGKKVSDARRNNHRWPTKTHITTKDRRIWRKLISYLCKDDDITLIEPLGE